MEDAILGNSKGATYKSFILDVEIVIKKEGTANVSEGRVKNKNTKGNNEESQETGRKNVPNKNIKQDVFIVNAGQTNLREVNNYHENEKSNVQNEKYDVLTDPQKSVSNENIGTHLINSKQQKHLPSNETNTSDTSSEKHQKKKRTHKTTHNTKVFKGKVEPVDFLECNRIFMCNYFELPKQNSDSALFYNYFGALDQILQEKLMENSLKNAKSVDEITSLKQKNNICIEPINKKLSLSFKELGNMYSKGDSYKTNNIGGEDIKKPPKKIQKITTEDQEWTDSQTSTNKCSKCQRDLMDLLSVKRTCNFCSDENIRTSNQINIVKEVVDLKGVKNNYSKIKKFAFFRRFKNIKKNLINPLRALKKFKKSE